MSHLLADAVTIQAIGAPSLMKAHDIFCPHMT